MQYMYIFPSVFLTLGIGNSFKSKTVPEKKKVLAIADCVELSE